MFDNIIEIKDFVELETANKMIKDGWVYLDNHKLKQEYGEKPVYIMGKIKVFTQCNTGIK